MLVRAESINELYVAAIDHVLRNGKQSSPRSQPTLEVFPAMLVLENPSDRVLTVTGRTINPAFAVAEMLYVLSGSDAPWIFDFNVALKNFTNDGVLMGAYGPRLRRWNGCIDQLARARATLLEDRNTRRAVVQIYDPASSSTLHNDVPCTIGYRFLLREGKLHMFTTMRSQDLWLGLPYDMFTNTVIHELMAHWVDAELGTYHHHVDSLHIYERDMSCARNVSREDVQGATHEPEPTLRIDWSTKDQVLAAAIDGYIEGSPGLGHFARAIMSYRTWKRGDRGAAEQIARELPVSLRIAFERWYHHLSTRAGYSNALAAAQFSADSQTLPSVTSGAVLGA